jgi:hypothetical protein
MLTPLVVAPPPCRAVLSEGTESKAVVRPYTPTSPPDARGYLDLVVKVGTSVLRWLLR